MSLKFNCIIVILLIVAHFAIAQENKEGIYFDKEQNVYIQVNRPIYLYISTDSIEEPRQIHPSKKNSSIKKQAFKIDKHGVHHLKHWDANRRILDDFVLNVDGISPKTICSDVVFKKNLIRDTLFYGKNLKVSLLAKDEMSKVKKTYYSLNNSEFKEYTDSINFDTEGDYKFSYYSIDNVGNKEETKTTKFSVDITPPQSNYSILGVSLDTVLSLKSILTLKASDNFSGLKEIYYRIDDGIWKKYNNKRIPLENLEDDEHILNYYAVDQVGNKEEVQELRFYFDISAPLVSLIALGDKFVLQNRVYFSGRTKLILLALDNKAGLKEIKYSINNKEFEDYKGAFYLPPKVGAHSVKYFAMDKVENKGAGRDNYSIYEQVSDMFFVDLLGPNISAKFTEPYIERDNKIYASNKTKIVVTAGDKESGLKRIAYSVNDDTTEIEYRKNIELNFGQGLHKINAIAYDNVNNRNIHSVEFIIDITGPEIFHYFSIVSVETDTIPVLPAYSKLFLAASDAVTGAKEIKYSINDGPLLLYRRPITGLRKKRFYKIKVVAKDMLNNNSEKIIQFRTR